MITYIYFKCVFIIVKEQSYMQMHVCFMISYEKFDDRSFLLSYLNNTNYVLYILHISIFLP